MSSVQFVDPLFRFEKAGIAHDANIWSRKSSEEFGSEMRQLRVKNGVLEPNSSSVVNIFP